MAVNTHFTKRLLHMYLSCQTWLYIKRLASAIHYTITYKRRVGADRWPAYIPRHWLTSLGDLVNSLPCVGCGGNYESLVSEHMLQLKFMNISWVIALRWQPQSIFDETSTLVLVMAWCRQCTSHYLCSYWPRSRVPYGITGPRGVIYTCLPQVFCHRNASFCIYSNNDTSFISRTDGCHKMI